MQDWVVSCRISDHQPRRFVRSLVEELGWVCLSNSGRVPSDAQQQVSAVVDDLSPWNLQAVSRIRSLKEADEGLPILLYYPDQRSALRTAAALAGLPDVWSKMQMRDASEYSRLRCYLAQLLDAAPERRLRAVIRSIVAARDPRIERYVDKVCEHVSHVPIKLRAVELVARQARLSVRQLETLCTIAGVPLPKRLLDWTVWVALAQRAGQRHVSFSRVASDAGLDEKSVDRLRSRLFAGAAPDSPRSDFIVACTAFASACGKRGWTLPRSQMVG